MSQAFDTIDILKLEIEGTPTGVRNLIKNPSGWKGAWGWITPVAGESMSGATVTPTKSLLWYNSNNVNSYFYSENYVVTPGQYITASFIIDYFLAGGSGTPGSIQIDFLNAAGTVISSSAATSFVSPISSGSTTPYTVAPLLIPASTVYARIKVNARGDGFVPFRFYNAVLATASTSTALNTIQVDPNWTNILSPSHELKISREGLNAGTLSARVLDDSLDPATSTQIRPGRQIRLQVWKLISGSYRWTSLFEGTVTNATVDYVPRVAIDIEASDAMYQLANASEPRGVETIANLRYLMEGKGVPWNINGSTGHSSSATIVATNQNASMIDQIAMTRDTAGGYAWVSRDGVLTAYDAASLPATTRATLSDSTGAGVYSYSDIDVSFNTEECINSVTVKYLRYNSTTGDSEEIVYGPYENRASIYEWGFHSAEFTIQKATESASAIETFANSVLTKNATPVVRIRSVTLPLRTTAEAEALSTLDLYDRVSLTYSGAGISNANARVYSVEHNITPEKWTVDLTFGAEGFAALPQRIPSPGIGA